MLVSVCASYAYSYVATEHLSLKYALWTTVPKGK